MIDRFGDEAVVICITQRDMDSILRHICRAVEEVLEPKAIYLKIEGRPGTPATLEVIKRKSDSDHTGMDTLGTPNSNRADIPHTLIELYENGVTYLVDLNKRT